MYMRYDIRTGEILAQVQCSPSSLHTLKTEGTDLLEGNVSAVEYWVDGDEFKARQTLSIDAPTVPFAPSDEPVAILSGLPSGCAVRIRGTQNMRFEAVVISESDGSIEFTPTLAGRYIVQIVGQFTAPDFSFEVQPLRVVKDRYQSAVTAKKAEQLANGFIWDGHRWDADGSAQANVTSMANAVSSGMPLPDGFYWTTFDNKDVELDADGISSLSAALMTFIYATHSYARQLKDEIEAQETNEAVLSVAIDKGWPE
jgi:hypothetical protein